MKFPRSASSSSKAPDSARQEKSTPRRKANNSSLEGAEHDEESEAKSAPAVRGGRSVPAGQLELLSEEQLTKLTRSNTRKNIGGGKSRFRSQMERVCRRLDNLAVEAKLQHRVSLSALPVVQPAEVSAVNSLVLRRGAGSSSGVGSQHDDDGGWKAERETRGLEYPEAETRSEDSFAIEPATNSSLFSQRSSSSRSGHSGGVPKSVRISTSVTVLDYERSDQPVSVARVERLRHPTRSAKSALLRRAIAEDVAFRQARLGGREEENGGEEGGGAQAKGLVAAGEGLGRADGLGGGGGFGWQGWYSAGCLRYALAGRAVRAAIASVMEGFVGVCSSGGLRSAFRELRGHARMEAAARTCRSGAMMEVVTGREAWQGWWLVNKRAWA